ncbi:retrovirus-related pol polyprotein from transposon TNT 1-94 [Tanacetum coccineum]
MSVNATCSKELFQHAVEMLRFSKCNMAGKPAMVTCVVDSMTDNLRPTHAEATDVANAVLDGELVPIFLLDDHVDYMDHTSACLALQGVLRPSFVKEIYVINKYIHVMKRSNWGGLPKIDEINASSKPVTSNSVPTPQESKIVKNDNVIAPRMFRINPFKPSREAKYVHNKVKASVRTNLITVSQPHVITKKNINFDSNGLSFTGVDNTTKTRRPQLKSNTKNDRVPSASKSSCNNNK